MTSSLLFWTTLALLGFWGIGAYNRLVRLRSDAIQAFAALEHEFTQMVELVQDCLPGPGEHPVSQFEGGSAFWEGLEGAAAQFTASLQAARIKPLDAERMAALGAAQEVLSMAWDRAQRDDAHDLAGPRLPHDVSIRREQVAHQAQAAMRQFNDAVSRYNDAIEEFPAVILAWLFSFRPGRGLRT